MSTEISKNSKVADLKLTEQEQLTLESYDINAESWVNSHSSKNFWEKEHTVFTSHLPSGSVLEIGSGGGRDAKELTKHYTYTGIDVSQGLLNEAQKNNPGATFVLASVYNLPFSENHFDGFFASNSLLHIPKERINEALQEIRRVVKHNGVGFITLKEGEGETLVEEKERFTHEMKRFFSYYSDTEFQKVLNDNNFEIIQRQRRIDPSNTWLIYYVRILKSI